MPYALIIEPLAAAGKLAGSPRQIRFGPRLILFVTPPSQELPLAAKENRAEIGSMAACRRSTWNDN
jgi:hypothetical protein